MHACLWGTYLNRLDKLMSWSLISLSLLCYNQSLHSYNHSQVIHSLPSEANSGSLFSWTILQSNWIDILGFLNGSVFTEKN